MSSVSYAHLVSEAGATLWNTATHQQLGGVLTPRNSGFLVFSPDNTTLAWVNAGVVSLLNVDADRQIGAAIGFDGPPAAVAFSASDTHAHRASPSALTERCRKISDRHTGTGDPVCPTVRRPGAAVATGLELVATYLEFLR
jgi:hypothetical protein